jgi:hypothetical protein
MVEPSRPDKKEGLFAGRLEGISLPDLLWMLRGQKKTGVLSLSRADVEKSIYFDEGRIVFVASSDPDDRLGEMLLRQGVISLDQLEEALANLHLGKRLGTLLVEAGSMSAGNLVSGVLAQVRSIVLDLFTWEEGDYRFEEGTLPTEEVITLDMKSNELLRSGIRQIRSFARIRCSVGPPRTVYGLTAEWREAVEGLSLSEAEEQLIIRFEQGDESVEQLCRDVLLSNFEIYQTLWVLKVQGVIQEREQQGRWAAEAAPQGSLENEGFADVMVRLSRGGETGVLYVRRRSEERSFHFRDGRCVFATSSNPDDSLVSYLLMRGVISLRDREETDKRLLSNKRVGTILRELGVIDDKDLGEMVRQQLGEIVFDTFRFADGDFSFVPGDLPSIEEITLEATAESLVLAGLRRVTCWSRVRRGCGGVDSRLELTPAYMNVLDRMNAGTEEWQVVTALKSAKSAKEVCRIVRLDDFRVCQILWALRVLGAVQPVGAADEVVSQPEPPVAAVVDHASQKVEVEELDPPSIPAAVAAAPEPAFVEPMVLEPNTPSVTGTPLRSAEPLEVADAADPSAVGEPPAPEQTQIISRDVVEAALQGAPAPPSESFEPSAPQPDATQAIPREAVDAALQGGEMESRDARVPTDVDQERPTEPATDGGDQNIWELEHSTRTVRLAREEVDAALTPGDDAGAPVADVAKPPPLARPADDWRLPHDLESIIAQFNAMQRVVYRTIRAEVGAGAANFIRSCCDTGPGAVDPLKGAELRSDGSWDTDGLRRAVQEYRIRDPRLEYQRLIDREIEVLRGHIGDARVLELERQIEKVEQATADS